MSGLNERCLESWRRVLPDYRIKQWDETNSPIDTAYSRAAYGRGQWSRLSNHVRLHALHTEGGIYLDTDVEVVRSLTPLLHHKCFLGFQLEEDQRDWVNTAVLGAQPGHPFLKRGLELIQTRFAETGEFPRSPAVTTALLREMGLKAYGLQEIRDVTVYPTEYFYPYPWFSTFAPDCIKENTYCVHYWEATWVEKDSKIRRALRAIKRTVRRAVRPARALTLA